MCCFSRFCKEKRKCVNEGEVYYDFLLRKKAFIGWWHFSFFSQEKESSRQQLEKSDRFSYFAT